ncbi:RNA polymerase sigma factor [Fimbriimonas ginsengisoli]|uniref:RNA polymerase sigma factor RpoE n=1 Tax=Fimbriimonas ginsengisoli Gsoil 348 TaxID=661478 RepID=A0A068NQH3_FIMGI|nr:sigma-70 family RNA polymerase sigma factor [Fimbriimonas ginsengisoli]AIE85602.1 RNA polymerase sigma factor RpoE [Fimbriimonas ginsengisoli Gsoil 348]
MCVIEASPILTLPRTDTDLQRFQDMMGQTRRRAYTMALQLTRNPADAEDLMQDTYVKAWKGFDSYLPGRPFLNWLLRIMQRAYLDSRRRDNPIRKAESLNSMISPSDGEVQELPIPDEGPSPDQEVLQDELRTQLHKALRELPDVYRDAITMCDLDGMSYSEIAEIQRTTIGTVRSRIHRGRRLLREILLQSGAFGNRRS